MHGIDKLEHDSRIFKVLERLSLAGIMLKAEKSEFRNHALGHAMTYKGIDVDPQKTDAIRKFPPPNDTNALQQFIGVVNHTAKFVA